jgi:hypothetical protein
MKKLFVWGLLLILVLLPVQASELNNTAITYTNYREAVSGEPGVVYEIKIINLGEHQRTYEIIPDTNAVKDLGTYRIDPSSKITLKAGKSQTFIFYLALEKDIGGRIEIPLQVISGDESTSLKLVARGTGQFADNRTGWFTQVLKIAFYTLLALIILVLVLTIIRRKRKGDKKDEESPDVETYY